MVSGWSDRRDGLVFFNSRYGDDSWEDLGALLDSPAQYFLSSAIDSSGTVHLPWFDNVDRSVWHARQTGGGGWYAGSLGWTGGWPSIAVNSADEPVIAFADVDRGYERSGARFDGSDCILDPVAGTEANNLGLGLDGDGGVHVAWYDPTKRT